MDLAIITAVIAHIGLIKANNTVPTSGENDIIFWVVSVILLHRHTCPYLCNELMHCAVPCNVRLY